MKKVLFLLAGVMIMGAGCTGTTSPTKPSTPITGTNSIPSTSSSVAATHSADLAVSDFVPPATRATNPPPASAGERRLFTATSTDGIHFTPTGTVFTEQGNVPDAVVTADGTIFTYYIGQGIEAGKETTAVAVSRDSGSTWAYKFLTLKNWPSNRPPSDPDVVLLSDGTFRMYYTDNVNGRTLGIAYGDSPDGITFTYKGPALVPTSNLIDSTTMFFDGLWHMYVIDGENPRQVHATSTDGITFALTDPSIVALPEQNYFISNPLIEGDTLRMFGFFAPPEKQNIRSFTTSDGSTWTAGDVALDATDAVTANSGYLQDSTVVKLANGTYLMIYVTEYAK